MIEYVFPGASMLFNGTKSWLSLTLRCIFTLAVSSSVVTWSVMLFAEPKATAYVAESPFEVNKFQQSFSRKVTISSQSFSQKLTVSLTNSCASLARLVSVGCMTVFVKPSPPLPTVTPEFSLSDQLPAVALVRSTNLLAASHGF